MRIRFLIFTALLLAWVPVQAQNAPATLTVTVDGVTARGGVLRVELYSEASYNGGAVAVDTRTLKASVGAQSVVFAGLAPGNYAVYATQDVRQGNGPGRTLMGTTQPFGYSGYVSRAKKPSFRDIRITVSAGDNATIVHLHS